MELSRRRLSPGETDHEFIWLTVSLGSLAGAAVWLRLGLPWPTCVFHDLTGWPCLTCGATRSAIEFFHGRFLSAWKWNPLAFIAYCTLSILNAYAAMVLITRAPRLRLAHFTAGDKKFLRVMAIALLGLNWLYLLASKSPF